MLHLKSKHFLENVAKMWHLLKINESFLTDLKAMIVTGPPSKGETEPNLGLADKVP